VQFLFANHTLDTDRRELRRGGTPVDVEPQVFDVLTYLLENRERVVSKDDLFASVWRGRIVADSTLASRINAARKAVGDTASEQRLIRTIARRGIRFVGDVDCQPRSNVRVQAIASLHERPEPRPSSLPPPDRPAIAVLAFANMSDDPAQEYFSDGISEDIITALSKLRWFFVIARNSSFTYKGKSVPLKQIAEELGVGYVIDGSVRKSGDRVRITVQLNDVASGAHLWSERYDHRLEDVFAVQDEITDAIVAAIEPQVYAAENFRASRKPPESLDAWDLVMQGLGHFWKVTPQDNLAAQALLERAITIDPHYGQALGLLALSYVFGTHMGWKEDRTEIVSAAERFALAAVRADSEDACAHLALAAVYVNLGRFDDSLAEFELSLRLNRNMSLAQGLYGLVLSACGRWREGCAAARRALRLSPRGPLSAIYNGIAAYAEFVGCNYDEAIRQARESVRQRVDFVGAHRILTAAAGMAGETEIATAALRELRRVQPNISLAWMGNHMLVRPPAEREHYLEGFRRAGLK
jgi:TolB-like protein/Tfp pilus assembly protein PilF